jgi:hypothetical protein
MNALRRRLLHAVLSIALVSAGFPVHALTNAAGAENTPNVSIEEQIVASRTDCPNHGAESDKLISEEAATDPGVHDCCGPDCRCSCAGLTLFTLQQIEAAPPPVLTENIPVQIRRLPSFVGGGLLRPPQA